jgi:general secretion pathway protein A
MYLDFYGLIEKPFTTTPDPKFLFHTASHREALAQLTYGVVDHKGFVVLTGEVGTGKTTLLHALRQRLNGTTATAFVFDSTLPFDGLLEYILEDFGVTGPTGSSQAQRLVALNNFLIERRRVGQNAVLLLDEAQNLSPSLLESVRLLSNFETPTEKLLQILLVGQPEFEAKLELPELRQLRQRVALHCRIAPLSPADVREYIRTRLRIAGAPDIDLFTDSATRRIATRSRGIPRVVNLLCDHCLVVGYTEHKRRIEAHDVDEAASYMHIKAAPAPRRRWTGWTPALAFRSLLAR